MSWGSSRRPGRRPGRAWLFFHGRRRSGFPWLLAAVILAPIGMGATFAGVPGLTQAGAPAYAYQVVVAGLIVAAIVLTVVSTLRRGPRRR